MKSKLFYVKTFFIAAVLSACSFAISDLHAEKLPVYGLEKDVLALFEFKSLKGTQLRFSVSIKNSNRQNIRLTIKNQAGDVLHSEVINNDWYDRVFVIEKDETEKLSFEVTDGRKVISKKTFRVTTKTEERVEVQPFN
ncbi:MAG: hypothetical protein SFU87_15745 [Chitinophagaceae bacterium]|nr:hypothetical protein [Chitinophagaceae bacterium]